MGNSCHDRLSASQRRVRELEALIKALAAAVKGDRDKARHHTISSAAVLLNWHEQLSGRPRGMRPGIEPPK